MKKIVSIFLLFSVLIGLSGCGEFGAGRSLKKPIRITVWTYYNGSQLEAFDMLISEFNRTEGNQKGIIVEHSSQGGINELAEEVVRACEKSVGAQESPNLAMVYSETAFTLAKMEMLANLDEYFSEEELARYVPSFIEEGRLESEGPLYIFPVAKSSEILILNNTDWGKFSDATGADYEELKTVEGVSEVSRSYYEWTDSLTPEVADDGKAFFGRDSLDNYMIIGAAQLGKELFPAKSNGAAQIDKSTMKTLWDNYYVPFVRGYFAAEGKFRSDDAKTGTVLAYVGSTSGTTYFPTKITLEDDSTYPITAKVLPAPYFENCTEPYNPQQGAGLSVIKQSAESDKACAEFLKWLTKEEQNLEFSVHSSYMPVLIEANSESKIGAAFDGVDALAKESLMVGIGLVNGGKLYVAKPFVGAAESRNVLRTALKDQADAAKAEVVAAMEAGETRSAAADTVCTEERFERWYEALGTELSQAIKNAN